MKGFKNKIMIQIYFAILTVFSSTVNVYATNITADREKFWIGTTNLIKDITGKVQGLALGIGIAFFVFNVIKMATGDEHEQQRYKKNLITIVICTILGVIAPSIIGYFVNFYQ